MSLEWAPSGPRISEAILITIPRWSDFYSIICKSTISRLSKVSGKIFNFLFCARLNFCKNKFSTETFWICFYTLASYFQIGSKYCIKRQQILWYQGFFSLLWSILMSKPFLSNGVFWNCSVELLNGLYWSVEIQLHQNIWISCRFLSYIAFWILKIGLVLAELWKKLISLINGKSYADFRRKMYATMSH